MEIPIICIGKLSFYQLMIGLAAILGITYLLFQKEYTPKQKIIVIVTTIISALIGARIFYLIINYKTITIHKIFSLQFTYFKGYGALIFSLLNIIVLSKIYKIKLKKTVEPLLMWFYIGGALAKIGCFFTGCCKGKPTELPWAIYRKFDETKVHPAELYDCGAFIFSLIILLILKTIKIKDSTRMAISLMVYVILRSIIEETYYNGVIFGDTISRIVYGVTIFICMCVIIKDIFIKYKKIRNNRLQVKT